MSVTLEQLDNVYWKHPQMLVETGAMQINPPLSPNPLCCNLVDLISCKRFDGNITCVAFVNMSLFIVCLSNVEHVGLPNGETSSSSIFMKINYIICFYISCHFNFLCGSKQGKDCLNKCMSYY